MIIEEKIIIDRPRVVDDTIDGETILVNLKNGNYYSFDKLGVIFWEAISRRMDLDALSAALSRKHNAEKEKTDKLVREFIHALLEEKLITLEETEGELYDPHSSEEVGELAGQYKGKLEPAVLNRYGDMQDMLLLDPIHDTDEKGWPKGPAV